MMYLLQFYITFLKLIYTCIILFYFLNNTYYYKLSCNFYNYQTFGGKLGLVEYL